MSPQNKLRKRPHPPPSYRPPPIPAAELSFIALSPPSPQAEYSNFPYSFHNYVPMNQEDRRRSRSQTRSSLSLTSIPTTTTRPGTVLTMNSTTPLLSDRSEAHLRSDNMPSRKLTKPRKPAAAQSNDFATLPYVELPSPSLPSPPPPPPPHPQTMPNYYPSQVQLPKRRPTINWKVTWSLRRRNTGKDKEKEISPKVEDSDEVKEELGVLPNVTPPETLPMTTQMLMPSLTLPPPKKFTLSPELDTDSDIEDYSHTRAEYDLDSSLDHNLPHSRARSRTPVHSGFNSSNGHYGHFTNAHRRNSAPVSRRWTLAMAMTSHELSDENFVQQVELMRRASITQFSDEVDESSYYYHGSPYDHEYDENETFEDPPTTYHHSHSQVHGHGQVPSMPDLRIRVPSASFPASPTSPTFPTTLFSPSTSAPESYMMYAPLPFDPPAADTDWSSALHALLITRDLLRTERNYLASLMLLLDSSPCGTSMSPNSTEGAMNGFFDPSDSLCSHPSNNFPSPETIELRTTLLWPTYPPPLLMHTYLCSLIATSSMLLAKFEADPSVMGAANALVSSEEEVERVFVGWCGVVGGWFEDKRRRKSYGGKEPSERRRRLSKTKFTESASASSSVAGSRSVSMVFSTPPSMSHSPSRPMSQINSASASRPILQRIPSLRPLSVIYPSSLLAEAIKTAPLPPRRATDISRSKLEAPLPPIPVEDERGRQPTPSVNGHTSLQAFIISNPEDQKGEVVFPSIKGRDTSVSTRDSSSPAPLRSPSTGLLGLVVSRLASSSSLAGGKEKDKDKIGRKLSKSKNRDENHGEEENEHKNMGKVERSRSVLLFGARGRKHPPLPDRAQTSPSSALKRSVSDYWKRSRGSRSRVPSSNATQKDLPTFNSSVMEGNGVPAVVHLNGDTNGNNSNSTSASGHGTDEGFYSECGGGVASTMDDDGYTSTMDGHRLKERKAINGAADISPGKPGGGIMGVGGKRVYSVRDLAILPVQRVTRYTLIYRDLLKHTPVTSPARPLLERAIEVSRRIAVKCDKAQGNAELLRRR
ncbi:rho guanine nucleotide exchange factor 17 [Moniliophthora roreri MCA 2997]|uniref:Rho guanine nucleotide exchange factor 17 n=1 Tax=Moniliophthora roreri (strain MCA 2997) TaxID=1381753 RepID=V2XIM9_MONRO|nr:rho guanine nucleotide exchange factor 17 [Moniliophthora roreri MCA 2997]